MMMIMRMMIKGDGDLSVELSIKMFDELRCFRREVFCVTKLDISHLPQCFSVCLEHLRPAAAADS